MLDLSESKLAEICRSPRWRRVNLQEMMLYTQPDTLLEAAFQPKLSFHKPKSGRTF